MKNILTQIVGTPAGAFAVLALAAALEVFGDACFQSGIQQGSALARGGWFLSGAVLLASYGFFVNQPPWDFGKLLGVYVVLFFVIAQIVAKIRFHQSPTPPVLAGGAFILAGGLIMTLWKR